MFRLTDSGDLRGSNFCVPDSSLEFLGCVRDVHLAEIRPGAVRGNHYHAFRRKVLCIRYTDAWSMHWDTGPDTPVQTENFSASGVVVVEIEPLVSHAVRNDGNLVMQLMGFSNLVFDPNKRETYGRQVV
jgi:hypothetical protein